MHHPMSSYQVGALITSVLWKKKQAENDDFLIQHGVSESIFRNSPCFQVGREPVHSPGSPPSDTSPPRRMATPKPLLSRKSVATTVGHKEINPLA